MKQLIINNKPHHDVPYANKVFILDYDDYLIFRNGIFYFASGGYVDIKEGGKSKKLHRVIMNVKNPRVLVDHINSNGMDNRKDNLRLCTYKFNSRAIHNRQLKRKEIPMEEFLSVTETAKIFKVQPETVRRWIYNNDVSAVKKGRKWFIEKRSLLFNERTQCFQENKK